MKRIVSAYSSSLLSVFSALLTNLWLLREIAQEVDASAFGLYGFILQITSYLAVLQLGLDMAASRQIAEFLGRDATACAHRAYRDLARFNSLLAWICGGASLLVAAFLWATSGGTLGDGLRAAQIALLSGLAQTLAIRARSPTAALIGAQFLALVNITAVARTITTALLAYCLLRSGWGVLCLPASGMLTEAIAWAWLERRRRRCCPWSAPEAPVDQASLFKPMLNYGLWTTLGGVGWTIESTCDVFIIQGLMGAEAVAAYVLWWRFPNLFFTLCHQLSTSAFPRFAACRGTGQQECKQLFRQVAYLTLGLSSLALVGIGLWLPAFMHHWLRSQYDLASGKELALLMGLLVCLRASGNLLGMFWLSGGRANLTTVSSWAQAILKVTLAMYWVQGYGIVGVVAASCVGSFLQCIIIGLVLGYQDFLRPRIVIKALLLTGGAALAVLGLGRRMDHPSLPTLTAGIIATVVCWGVIWLVLAWFGELRPSLARITRFGANASQI